MSSRDKETKTFHDKLKDMFRRKGHSGTTTGRGEFILSSDLLRDLGKDSPVATRTRVLKELSETVTTCKLECTAIAKLWELIEDIFCMDNTEIRHLAFSFLQCLLRGQGERLKIMRAQFFRFIKQHYNPEDVALRFDLLVTLTSNGKDIVYFEEEVGPFLLNWLPDITQVGKIHEYLSMVDNLLKFNATYLEDIIAGLIQHVCVICCSTNNYTIVMTCLQIMSTTVAYSNMPPESLPQFIGVLCRTVIIESYCNFSWKIMKNLLGTHMGHSTLFTMCRILQEPGLKSDTQMLRGAVFYIHMALWGNQPLTNLHCPPSSVLPSILAAVKCNQAAVGYEVIIGIQHLVIKQGLHLQDPAWSIVLEIVSHVSKQIDAAPNQTPNNLLAAPLHDTLNTIENLIEVGSYNGSIKQFFTVIEECASARPDSSIMRLVAYLAEAIIPTEHLWLTNLYNLLHKYFKPDVKTSIRLKVLDVLSNVVKLNRMQYEDELLDRIVIPHMLTITQDSDVVIRTSVCKLLVDLCKDCESKRCLEMLDILEKLLFRPFEHHDASNTESEHADMKCLISGLIGVFTVKIHKLPSSHAIKIYKMLVHFLELHYSRPKVIDNSPELRYMIFECFLKMRADSLYHLGCPDVNGKMTFSSYLCVTHRGVDRGPLVSPPPPSPAISQQPPCTVSYVSLRPVFKVFITCLKVERDWEVLSLVLRKMTKALQNKSLILSKQGNNELGLLVEILCAMISDRSLSLPESLNVKISRADFHSAVLFVLVNLASYHSYLDSTHQQKMIRCLMKCIQTGPRGSKQCIAALTICTMEMREAMVKILPEVLLNLSKVSATVHIAIPVLEFLSTLTQLPMVFANFVADQYMAVFAISLPYTNPFKYNHYTVSLAHHVIAVWFLKCRLPFRKDFVKFITNGLQTNVLIPFEETNFQTELSKLNQDSSDRKRSSSLTEQSSRRRSAVLSRMEGNKSATYIHRPPLDQPLMMFYEELTETCIDLMARYAFSPCSALPRRLPTAEFLLNGGQNMCWLVGNKLVTVTTSGCSQKVLKHGLCDKCWTLCSSQNENKMYRTARSGSNDKDETWVTRQNSNEKSNNNTSASSPLEESKKSLEKLDLLPTKLQQLLVTGNENQEKQSCACWCQGWAEVYVRRPTGDMSWVMRIQNQISSHTSMYEFPLNEISTLFMPSLPSEELKTTLRQRSSEENASFEQENSGSREMLSSDATSGPGTPTKLPPSRQNSRESVEEEGDFIYDDGTKSRNPVRRSNSSPEMSGTWKHPFLHQKQEREAEDGKNQEEENVKKSKMYSKDMRVSYEAIPEENAGTTPPSSDLLSQKQSLHPNLLSCHSYPGSSPPKESSAHSKPYQTLPASPNVVTSSQPPSFIRAPGLKSLKSDSASFKTDSMESVGSDKVFERPSNLPNLSSLMPLSAKPPQSPTQTSPRMSRHSSTKEKDGHEIQKSLSASLIERNNSLSLSLAKEKAKERKNSSSVERLNLMDPQKRDRVHTISVMSPATRKPRADQLRQPSNRSKEAPRSGINPSFVFLQLYHAAHFGHDSERPLLVGSSDFVQRGIKVLDQIPPYEIHKIGVVYIREGQCNNEAEILRNRFGSLRYVDFLQNLGTLIKLSDVDPQVFFLGGLEQNGEDGKFAYIWQDDVIRVTFHVATMMPNKESDPNCNNKKRHIGNNYVTIVYNESNEEFNIDTFKSQFNFASIIIEPLDHNTNRVTVKTKDNLNDLMAVGDTKIVSDQNVSILARQLALHANLASMVASSLKSRATDPYASNWLERLRKIKSLRNKILQDNKNKEDNPYPSEETITGRKKQMEDFTDYT